MEFYYDKKNAGKYQLLSFPQFYWAQNFIPQDSSSLGEEGFAEEEKTMADTQGWMEEMALLLKPFGREIEKYYGQTWHSIHLFTMVMKVVDLFSEPTVFAWLTKAMAVDEQTLRVQMLVTAWCNMEEMNQENMDARQLAEVTAVAGDMAKWSGFLENTLLAKEECWRILQFLTNPLAHLQGYYNLLKDIEPLYLKQTAKIALAHQEGVKIARGLSRDIQFLNISYSLENDEMYREIVQDGRVRVLSVLFPNSVNINGNPPFMAVGWQVTYIIKLLTKTQRNLHRRQAETFKILGDGTRYQLFILITQGVTTTKELAEKLNISGASVTYHIQMLIEGNLLHANWRKRPLKERLNKEKILAIGKQLKEDLNIE